MHRNPMHLVVGAVRNLVRPVGGQRVNLLLRYRNEILKRAVEGRIADTTTGDENRGLGRWRIERQGGAVAQLVQSLRDVRGPDDELPGALRLAKFEHQGAARSTVVCLVTRQYPVKMEQAGESGDIDVRSDQHDHFGRR